MLLLILFFANAILGLAAFVLIIVTIVAVANHKEWSYGKRWLWGILSFVLGLLGSGIAAVLIRRKNLAIINFAVLAASLAITVYFFYFVPSLFTPYAP